MSERTNTIAQEERAIKREKKNVSNTVTSVCFMVVIALGLFYMVDLNSAVTSGLSGVYTFIHNGISGFFEGSIPLDSKVPAAYIKSAMGWLYIVAALVGLYSNKQQR